MTKEQAIEKIKDQLKKLMSFSSEEATVEQVKCASMKLKDGSEILIADGTELGIGVAVFKLDPEGNQIPAEDGEYELEDGRKITLKGGLIEAIAEIETEDEKSPMTDAEMAEVAKKAEEEIKKEEKMEEGIEVEVEGPSVEERISNLEGQIGQILEILQNMGSMQEVAMSKIEAIASAPATESIKVGKKPSANTSVAFSSYKSEIEQLKEVRKKFNLTNKSGYSFKATISQK
jgi:hypothetical protein